MITDDNGVVREANGFLETGPSEQSGQNSEFKGARLTRLQGLKNAADIIVAERLKELNMN